MSIDAGADIQYSADKNNINAADVQSAMGLRLAQQQEIQQQLSLRAATQQRMDQARAEGAAGVAGMDPTGIDPNTDINKALGTPTDPTAGNSLAAPAAGNPTASGIAPAGAPAGAPAVPQQASGSSGAQSTPPAPAVPAPAPATQADNGYGKWQAPPEVQARFRMLKSQLAVAYERGTPTDLAEAAKALSDFNYQAHYQALTDAMDKDSTLAPKILGKLNDTFKNSLDKAGQITYDNKSGKYAIKYLDNTSDSLSDQQVKALAAHLALHSLDSTKSEANMTNINENVAKHVKAQNDTYQQLYGRATERQNADTSRMEAQNQREQLYRPQQQMFTVNAVGPNGAVTPMQVLHTMTFDPRTHAVNNAVTNPDGSALTPDIAQQVQGQLSPRLADLAAEHAQWGKSRTVLDAKDTAYFKDPSTGLSPVDALDRSHQDRQAAINAYHDMRSKPPEEQAAYAKAILAKTPGQTDLALGSMGLSPDAIAAARTPTGLAPQKSRDPAQAPVVGAPAALPPRNSVADPVLQSITAKHVASIEPLAAAVKQARDRVIAAPSPEATQALTSANAAYQQAMASLSDVDARNQIRARNGF